MTVTCSSQPGLDHKVTVSMIVDENGVPNDLKVVTSDDVVANQNFSVAASQYRFKPGTSRTSRPRFP